MNATIRIPDECIEIARGETKKREEERMRTKNCSKLGE